MDIKFFSSIIISGILAYVVYILSFNLVPGLSPFLLTVLIIIILILLVINLTLIKKQRQLKKRIITLFFLITIVLGAAFIGLKKVNNTQRMNNGTPRRYSQTFPK